MKRACEHCEWWDRDGWRRPNPGVPAGEPKRALCKESPRPEWKQPDDWCGRWRVAEQLTGGIDFRSDG